MTTLRFTSRELIPALNQSLEGKEHVTTGDYPGKDGPALLLAKGDGVSLQSNAIDRDEVVLYAEGYDPDSQNINERCEDLVYRGIRIQTIPVSEEWLIMARLHEILKIHVHEDNFYELEWE